MEHFEGALLLPLSCPQEARHHNRGAPTCVEMGER